VKFRESSGFRLQNGQLTAVNPAAVPQFQSVLAAFDIQTTAVHRLFSRSPEELDVERREGQERTGEELADLNLYFIIDVPAGRSTADVADRLNAPVNDNIVELAEPARLPSPPPQTPTPTPDFTGDQHYKDARSRHGNGIGLPTTAQIPGSDGDGMQAVDTEYSWRLDHEDLKLPNSRIHLPAGCTAKDPYNDTNHGTAVLGEVIALANAYGVTGIAPAATALVVPTNCEHPYIPGGNQYNPADAINVASSLLKPGDVIIVEQQTSVCSNTCAQNTQVGCGPLEYWQPVFDVVKSATSTGRIVVEAAGNGRVNLDSASCQGKFNRRSRDSRAIIVGAGSSANHSRLNFSSFGSRVDVQGWGENIITTGYGDAFPPDPPKEQRSYTRTFGGTSGATPIVASAILSINGARKACGLEPAAPREMRLALSTTGTQQTNSSTGHIGPPPPPDHIGPLPDIRAALVATGDVDTCLPVLQISAPTIVSGATAGGPFTPSSLKYTLSASMQFIDFSIVDIPDWIRSTPTSGKVDTSGTVIEFTVNDAKARNLPIGKHEAQIWVLNTNNGLGDTMVRFTLDIH